MPANRLRVLGCAIAFGVIAWTAAPAQEEKDKEKDKAKDKVQRSVTAAKLESILQDMKIKYQKVAGKPDGVYFYDFERNKFKVRLHNYEGRDLWIDVQFTDKMTPEEVNEWNVRAKFSRAVRVGKGAKQLTSLESQIECQGGVTDGMIRQFILRFDGEIKTFVEFITK